MAGNAPKAVVGLDCCIIGGIGIGCTGLEWMLFIWFIEGAFPAFLPFVLPSRLSRSILTLPAFFQVVPTLVVGFAAPEPAVPLPSSVLLLTAFRG